MIFHPVTPSPLLHPLAIELAATWVRTLSCPEIAAPPDAEVIERCYIEYYLALSAQASQQFADYGQRDLFDALATELDNLRAIMRRAHRSSRHAEQGARICNALRIFWALKGSLREGVAEAERFLADTALPTDLRAIYTSPPATWPAAGRFPARALCRRAGVIAHRSANTPDAATSCTHVL